MTVGKREHRHLGTRQKFLDDDFVAGLTELLVLHDGLDSGDRLVNCLRDNNALAERQTVRLDDNRCGVLSLYIVNRLLRVVKHLIFGGRNAVLFHHVLGEHLARLNNRGVCVRTEGADACRFQRVHHAGGKRIVGSDKHKVNGVVLGKPNHALLVHHVDGDGFGVARNAAVAGSTVELFTFGAFKQLFDERVLSAAGAYH